MTWKELNVKVEEAGLQDLPLGELHVQLPIDEGDPDIFKNAQGTLTVANSCCS